MSFALDSTEQEILDTVRDVAAARVPLAVETPADPTAAYHEFGNLGFFGLNVDEDRGGVGLTDFHAGLVAYGFGRELVPGPWLEHLVAVAIAREFDGDLTRTLAAGDRIAAEAVSSGRSRTTHEPVRVAAGADLWLLLINGGIVAVERESVEVRPAKTVELRWTAETLRVADAPVTVLGELGDAAFRHVQLFAAGLTAMASVGASERVLALTTSYARDRVQFGKPIGSFQAVKHRLADLYIEIEHVRSLAFAALASADGERERLLPMAAVLASNVYRTAAEASIHLHGGIGFTWECPVHAFLKNALRLRTYPIPLEAHRRAIRAELALEPTEDLA